MTARLVKLGGVQVQEGGVDVVFGDDAPPAVSSAFNVMRNGTPETLLWNNAQLNSISLAMAANDAEIGMGTVTRPGDPGWVAGDRITWTDNLGNILYTGYVMNHSREWNPAAPTEMQTTYQLMDVNRQLIGRKVVDWVRPEETSLARLLAWFDDFMSDLTLDMSYVYAFGGAIMPAKTYTTDGIMDVLADVIRYTGNTLFLTVSQDGENTFEVHYSQPAVPLTQAGIDVTDVLIDIDNIDVWGMSDENAGFDAGDMKNDVTGRNGTAEYGYTNATSVTAHNVGGLFFQAVVDYAVDFVDLQILVNNILNPITGAGEEKSSYAFTIRNLTGSDVIRVPSGCAILIQSTILGVSGVRIPILHETLTVSHDVAGNPLPGWWDLALELQSAVRQPAAVRGYGGQGGSSGALSEDFSIADHINVIQPDQLPPVGFSMIVEGHVVDDIQRAVRNKDVSVTWSLDQWQDDAGTIPSVAWSLDDVTTLTDENGVAVVVLSHDTDDDWAWVQVNATL